MAKKQRIQYVRFEAPQKIGLLVAAIVGMGSAGAVGYFMGQLSPRSLDAAYVVSEPLALATGSSMEMPIPSNTYTFDSIFGTGEPNVPLPPPPMNAAAAEGEVAAEASGGLAPPAPAVEVAEVVEFVADEEPLNVPVAELEAPEPVAAAPREEAPTPTAPAADPTPASARVAAAEVQTVPARPVSRSAPPQDPEVRTQEAGLATAGVVSSTRTVSRGRPRSVGSAVADSQDVVVSRVSSHDDAESARQALRGASLTATVRRAADGDGFEVVLRTSGSEADRERQEQIGRRVLSEQ